MRLFYDMDLADDEGGGGDGSKTTHKPAPTATPLAGVKPTPIAPTIPGRIPLPNYSDPQSRLQYAHNWTQKYGPLMKERGDTPLRINEVPDTGTDTVNVKQAAINAAKPLGLDPALFYSSAMEEGMSGLFKDKNGMISTGEHTTDKYPVSGFANFGLDTFADRFPDLVKKGYLPKEFADSFSKSVETNEKGQQVNSANFKTAADALKAKAAFVKSNYDDIDSYAKQRGIKLSPKARDFFALANYNGGGIGHEMLNDYYNAGQLENDKFLQARPTSGGALKATSYGPIIDKKTGKQTDEGIYDHIKRRILMQEALKKEGLFDDK